jgi:nitrite reductase/ring-hydroxylating ferredoxin subunit
MTDATIPKWRRDFPFTSEGEDEVTRREFARYLVLASATFAVGSAGVAAWTSLRPMHLGCVVYWSPEREQMLCPCHEGVFDPRTGGVVAGPP